MGFFSYTCAKTGVSIPNTYTNFDSKVVLVTPDNRKIKGEYDGYGRVGDKNIHVEVARSLEEAKEKTDKEIRSLFFKRRPPVKIVRAKNYDGEDFDDLDRSKDCPYQGYFYDDKYIKENYRRG